MWDGRISAYIISCTERLPVRRRTLASFAASDWRDAPVVVLDLARYDSPKQRVIDTAERLLHRALDGPGDVFVFLEDDVECNAHLRHNLEHWPPLVERPVGGHFFASLYNPNIVAPRSADDPATWVEVDPPLVYGSQAYLMAVPTARYILDHWDDMPGLPDHRMARLAARVTPVFFHRPSLVEHLAVRSGWGGPPHESVDFDAEWRADSL